MSPFKGAGKNTLEQTANNIDKMDKWNVGILVLTARSPVSKKDLV